MWITSECAVIQAPSTNYLVTSAAVELVSIGAEYAVMGAMKFASGCPVDENRIRRKKVEC